MNIYGGCGTRKFLNSREVYVSIRVSKYIAILDRSLTSKINTKRYMCVKNSCGSLISPDMKHKT